MYYVLSVGTNIGDRKENIENCKKALALVPETQVVSASPIYETQPIGYDEQDNFYNCCLLVSSKFSPSEMLGVCMGIEAGFGRVRKFKNGPRIIDIDIIFAQDLEINTKNLTVPHPRYSERRFVLRPLMDIFVDGVAFGIDFKKYLEAIQGQEIKKIEE